MRTLRYQALLFFLNVAVTVAGAQPVQYTISLPMDETEARRMLADGSLDSATWAAVAPFYAEPLRVPAGQLALLGEVFPELAGLGLPSARDSLQGYDPWTVQDIQRFFADHPHLAAFGPVLSFDPGDQRAVGSVSVRLRGEFGGEQGPQYVNVTLGAGTPVTVRARLRVESDYAVWQHRSVRIASGTPGTFVLGHYMPVMDDGLVLGRFAGPMRDTVNPFRRFLLGESRAFNGIRWYGRWAGRTAAEAFAHCGQRERAGGAHVRFGAGRMLDLQVGMTVLLPCSDSSGNMTGAVHAATYWRHRTLHASLRSCVMVSQHFKVPLEMTAGWRQEQAHADVQVVYLPDGFAPPWARLPQEIRGELDSTGGAAWRAGVDAGVRLHPSLHVRPFLVYTRGEHGAASCRAGLAATGTHWLNYAVRYRFTPGAAGGHGENRHLFHLVLSRNWRRVFGVELSGRWYARGAEYWSGRVSLMPALRFGPGVQVAPEVSLRGRRGGPPMVTTGLRHELRLREKVDGVLEVRGPLMEGSGEETTFSGTLRFLL